MSSASVSASDFGIDLAQVAKLPTRPIVFFDGVCGLCDRTVNRLLKCDKKEVLLFAPLQGETARQVLPAADIQELGSMIFWHQDRAYRQSAAVVRILWTLGGGYRVLAALLWLIPLPLRDWGYRRVAANRYRWFGKHDACRMPTPAERARFLP